MESEVHNIISVNTIENSPFYTKAKSYWSKVSPTVDGVLGGFGFISDCDIKCSEQFLSDLFKLSKPPGTKRALDCGAGIGRITKHLLIRHFDKVDLIDQNKEFVEKSKEYVHSEHLGNLYCGGLQDFKPVEKYDVIWCQWVLGHLKDEHFVHFMMTCRESLSENGLIVIKENVTSSGQIDVDETDSSVTRPTNDILRLLKESNLEAIKIAQQTSFPEGLYPVYMFALRPADLCTLSQ